MCADVLNMWKGPHGYKCIAYNTFLCMQTHAFFTAFFCPFAFSPFEGSTHSISSRCSSDYHLRIHPLYNSLYGEAEDLKRILIAPLS